MKKIILGITLLCATVINAGDMQENRAPSLEEITIKAVGKEAIKAMKISPIEASDTPEDANDKVCRKLACFLGERRILQQSITEIDDNTGTFELEEAKQEIFDLAHSEGIQKGDDIYIFPPSIRRKIAKESVYQNKETDEWSGQANITPTNSNPWLPINPNPETPLPEPRYQVSRVSSSFINDTGTIHCKAFENGTVEVWTKRADGSFDPNPQYLNGHTQNVTSIVISYDEKTIITDSSFDGSIRLWIKQKNGSYIPHPIRPIIRQRQESGPYGFNDKLMLSSDNKLLAILEEHKRPTDHFFPYSRDIYLWVQEDNGAFIPHPTTPVLRPDNRYFSIAMSNDGNMIICGSYNDVHIFIKDDTGSFIPHPKTPILKGHTDRVASVAINKSGNVLASGSADHTVRIWIKKDGSFTPHPKSPVLQGHTGWVDKVQFINNSTLNSYSRGHFRYPERIQDTQDNTKRIWKMKNNIECIATELLDKAHDEQRKRNVFREELWSHKCPPEVNTAW